MATSTRFTPDLIAGINGGKPLAMLRGENSTIFAARWEHSDLCIPVHEAAQNILCFHESGTTQVHKFERGKLLGNRSQPGSVTFIPMDGTEWEIIGQCKVIHVYLDPILITECANQYAIPSNEIAPFFSVSDPWLQGFFKMLAVECELYGGETDSLLLSQSQIALVTHLLRWHSSSGTSVERIQKEISHAIPPQRLRAVLEYIDANLGQPLHLKELASVACFSEFHFARCFKEAVGVTPYRFVLDKRIAAAANRLSSDSAPIKSIAHDVGFTNSRHFSATFKAWCGKSPAEYRKERQH